MAREAGIVNLKAGVRRSLSRSEFRRPRTEILTEISALTARNSLLIASAQVVLLLSDKLAVVLVDISPSRTFLAVALANSGPRRFRLFGHRIGYEDKRGAA